MEAPQRHVRTHHTATYARVCSADTHSFSYTAYSGLIDLHVLMVTASYFHRLPPAADVVVVFWHLSVILAERRHMRIGKERDLDKQQHI